MSRLHHLVLRALVPDDSERGANLVEYMLLLVFIAIVMVGILLLVGQEVSGKYSEGLDSLTP